MACLNVVAVGFLPAISAAVGLFGLNPSFLKAGTAGGDWIVDNLFATSEQIYPAAAFASIGFVVTLQMVALWNAPRLWRVPTQLGLAAVILFVNNYRENGYAVQFTNDGIPLVSLVMHYMAAAVYVAGIFLPAPQAVKESSSSKKRN